MSGLLQRLGILALLATLPLVAASGCARGDEGEPRSDPGADGGLVSSADPSVPGDSGSVVAPPGDGGCQGSSCCSADLATDVRNCGSCGRVCAPPVTPNAADLGSRPATAACVSSRCGVACAAGDTKCDDACFNLVFSSRHCGKCGNSCAGTDECFEGVCCSRSRTVCGARCVNLADSADNCGACGQACPSNRPSCISGQCYAPVAVGYSEAFPGSPIPASDPRCSSWNAFRGRLTGTYGKITIKGNNDPVGQSCTGASANLLCKGLNTGTAVSVACDGRNWSVGDCNRSGGAQAPAYAVRASLLPSNPVCICEGASTSPYEVAPCSGVSGTGGWGGILSYVCLATPQVLTVICE